MKGTYFGSVRFYKNLILAVILLLIGLGFGLSLRFHHSLKKTQKELNSLKTAASQFLYEDENGSFVISSGEDLAYQQLYPDFRAPAAPVTVPEEGKTVYLTFDGDFSGETSDILDALAEKNVKATFFVTGSEQSEARDTLRRIAEEGHSIGMLSWSSEYADIYQSVEAYLTDMYQLFVYVQDTTGITPSIFRFPGGSVNSYNAGLYRELIAEMIRRGFVPFDWNITSQDTVLETSEEVSLRITSLTEPIQRSIVLLHSTSDLAAAALDPVVDTLQEEGFAFAPLDEHVKPILFSY